MYGWIDVKAVLRMACSFTKTGADILAVERDMFSRYAVMSDEGLNSKENKFHNAYIGPLQHA